MRKQEDKLKIMQNSNFGFLNQCEFVPEEMAKFTRLEINMMFLNLFNAYFGKDYHLSLKFAKKGKNLSDIFVKFIDETLKPKPLKFAKTANFCAVSNSFIYSYLNDKILIKTPKIPKYKVAKILSLLKRFDGEFGINLESNMAFENYVFEKISLKQASKCDVLLDKNAIIVQNSQTKIAIFTNFKPLDFENRNYEDDIKMALVANKELNSNIIYLVYPRNQNFKRHIEIKSADISPNLLVKLVPYKISEKIYRKDR